MIPHLLCCGQVFHDIAYKAKDRQDLLAGIEEFLDEVIVLPPGEWDPDIRIEPPKSLPSSDKRYSTATHTHLVLEGLNNSVNVPSSWKLLKLRMFLFKSDLEYSLSFLQTGHSWWTTNNQMCVGQ